MSVLKIKINRWLHPHIEVQLQYHLTWLIQIERDMHDLRALFILAIILASAAFLIAIAALAFALNAVP